jgi:hypothetical protein
MTPPNHEFAAAHSTSLQSDEAADREQMLTAEYDALRKTLRDEFARPAPDLSRTRTLKTAIAALRVKIAIAQGEPPPHTD